MHRFAFLLGSFFLAAIRRMLSLLLMVKKLQAVQMSQLPIIVLRIHFKAVLPI